MEKNVFTKKLAKRISKARKDNGITQVQMAKMFNLPQQNISRLEAGISTPSAYFVYEIARVLKVPVGELMEV